MKLWMTGLFAAAAVLFSVHAFSLDYNRLQVGDIIFQKSQSQQSQAIREATGSDWTHVGVLVKKPNDSNWYVAEAARSSMDVVSLESFIDRSLNSEVVVKRINPKLIDLSKTSNQNKLVKMIYSFAGKKYDIFFEWSDEAIYCSELVAKSFKRTFNIQTGVVQKIRDLNLSGPAVKKLMAYRQQIKGSPINLDEPIVTPISVFEDANLSVVTNN